ncbi:hypothetical protein [Adlercreutzia sp. ZJ138]|uniref:hypothetical protein n=1 Tax=Adlercreutzia sp. ZJ138 TaxID=2709405 RepID=UPI0013ED86B7|nr:hypothetical protein [Adlercreutzia sp. ZJ138]
MGARALGFAGAEACVGLRCDANVRDEAKFGECDACDACDSWAAREACDAWGMFDTCGTCEAAPERRVAPVLRDAVGLLAVPRDFAARARWFVVCVVLRVTMVFIVSFRLQEEAALWSIATINANTTKAYQVLARFA